MQPEQQRHEYISRHVEAMRGRFSRGYMARFQRLKRWVAWSASSDETGNIHKVPRNPNTGYNASINKPETWGTLDQALNAYASGAYEGIGVYVLSPYVLVDMDGSFDPSTKRVKDERAARIIRLLNSCTEVSPRKEGTHVIIEAIPLGANFRIPGLEVYTNWFATVTTWHLPGTPIDIANRQAELEAVYRQYAPGAALPVPQREDQNTVGVVGGHGLSDLPPEAEGDQVLDDLLNGVSLYGNTSVDEYVSLMKLMHYTGDDRAWTKAIFSSSPIGQRAKAREDTKEGRRGTSTYLDNTIDAVLRKRRNKPVKR
jgi:primase-polymerase (primpol)-like protein